MLSKVSLLAGEAVAIRCAHGDTVLCPLAQVQLEVERQAMEVTVAVADKLPMSVLLGTDIPLLSKLQKERESYKRSDQCIKLIVL